MNEKDLEECLRAINPVDEGQVRPREDTLVGILEHAAAVGDRRGRISSFGPPRTRRRIAAVVLAAVALAATTAAVFAMTRRPTTSPLSVGCYDRLDQNADTAVFDTVGQDLSPAAICARGWQSAFGEPAPQMLVTCVVSAGGTGVFPNEAGLSPEEACASISASVPSGGSPYGGLSADQVRLLAADLEHRFAGILDRPECAGQVGLKAEVQAALLEYANATWTIVDSTSATQEWTFPDGASALVPVPTTAEGQHCAGYAIDAVGAKVILVNSWPELPGTVPKD
jgi:hypothetical protein